MNSSKTDEIYNLVKQKILNKELKPGMQLKEEYFSKKFNVSRGTLRTTLMKLENDNIIEIIFNKGSYIVDPSYEDICSAYKLRIKLIDILFDEIVKQEINYHFIRKLENYIELQSKNLKENNLLNYIENNKKFHLEIAKLSNNKYLVEMIEKLMNINDIFLIFYNGFDDTGINDIEVIKEHKLILKYLKEKNLKKTNNAIIKHIENSFQKLKKKENE